MGSFCILGGGLIGRFVAEKLSERKHEIRVIDSEELIGFSSNIITEKRKITSESISKYVSTAEVVINCLPGRIGHEIRKPLLSIKGMRVADLAFTEEDPQNLNELAIAMESKLIYDIGIAPGLSNALLMSAQQKLNHLESAKIWVGGNPQEPDDEWSYMAPFSPSDVIEEYTRPARFIRNGKIITKPALSERHIIDVPTYGKMEAFLTDGVRSLLNTINCSELVEYTVRWPGHIEKYLENKFTEKELIEAWKFNDKIPEFTWLDVLACDKKTCFRWEVLDSGKNGWSSMARTTGLVTVEVSEILAEGKISSFGVIPPEELGKNKNILQRIIKSMQREGIQIIYSKIEKKS